MENTVDLRGMLLELYLKNNPKMAHQIFIYSFNGVIDTRTNPFQYVSGDLPPNIKKSLVLQNLASGEMIQAFVVPIVVQGQAMFHVENLILYGNKSGTLIEIDLDTVKIIKTDKYRQFINLTHALLRQFA
ncbi:hypothetical protein [Conchiformibius steedae]|uniref:hypothetical protein n=1 Tax=Conchiformibius steedae TaxID=153493 RepID=UPI0026EE4910|nr:hypothetical protein [Conchiformibius steedae]